MKKALSFLFLIYAIGCGSKKQESGKGYYIGATDSTIVNNIEISEDSLAYVKSRPIEITPYNIDSFAKAGLIKGNYEVTEWTDSNGWKLISVVFKKKTDTFTPPKRPEKSYYEIYPNLSPTRDVKFDITKNYTSRTYDVYWQLWIDGDIAMSDIRMDVSPESIEKYKASVRMSCNKQMPFLLRTWTKH